MKTLKKTFANAMISEKSGSQIFGGTGITDPDLSGAAADIDITDPELADAPRGSNLGG